MRINNVMCNYSNHAPYVTTTCTITVLKCVCCVDSQLTRAIADCRNMY